jgi:hypothetical protein
MTFSNVSHCLAAANRSFPPSKTLGTFWALASFVTLEVNVGDGHDDYTRNDYCLGDPRLNRSFGRTEIAMGMTRA